MLKSPSEPVSSPSQMSRQRKKHNLAEKAWMGQVLTPRLNVPCYLWEPAPPDAPRGPRHLEFMPRVVSAYTVSGLTCETSKAWQSV